MKQERKNYRGFKIEIYQPNRYHVDCYWSVWRVESNPLISLPKNTQLQYKASSEMPFETEESCLEAAKMHIDRQIEFELICELDGLDELLMEEIDILPGDVAPQLKKIRNQIKLIQLELRDKP